MKTNHLRHCFAVAGLMLAAISQSASAATLASATFDTDSYIFIGTNNSAQLGISSFTDYSGGVLDALANGHFNFGVIKFDNLAGIQTVANGGPSKFLTLETMQSGTGVFGVSVAGADFQTSYLPAGSGNPKLQWYFDNIKGDDAAYGGYAGGADHVGVLNVAGSPSVYSLDVTAVVDAWIDGSVPNYGFGLWAESTSAAQGSDLDFASMENPIVGGGYFGPRLTSVAIPEPATIGLVLVGLVGALVVRKRS
jgi:hypothetical protein